MKAVKTILGTSLITGSVLLAPLDTPLHKAIREPKIKLYEALRSSLIERKPQELYKIENYLMTSGFLEPNPIDLDEKLSIMLPNSNKVSNPISLAAGYDKEGGAVDFLFDLGFGAVEIGSLSPGIDTSEGNAILRVDPENFEVEFNGYLNNWGTQTAKSNLRTYYELKENETNYKNNVLGVNIRPTLETQDFTPFLTTNEFNLLARDMIEYSDYLVMDLSDINGSEGLKQYKDKSKLKELIEKVKKTRSTEIGYLAALEYEVHNFKQTGYPTLEEIEARNSYAVYHQFDKAASNFLRKQPLLLLKIDANLPKPELDKFAAIALETGIDGFVVGSMLATSPRGKDLDPIYKSGKVLAKTSKDSLEYLYKATNGKLVLISSGGVTTPQEALDRIKAGATLVQIYTKFLIDGPYKMKEFMEEFEELTLKEINKYAVNGLQDLIGRNHKKL